MLGGVKIACDKSVVADSDGDVLLHALADALLGAAAMGDIGEFFPSSSAQGLSGETMIVQVLAQVRLRGFRAVQVDLTLICEQPRLSPHRLQVQQNVARLLAISPEQVGVKATTTDGLGLTGRGEGIAAMALVLLSGAGVTE